MTEKELIAKLERTERTVRKAEREAECWMGVARQEDEKHEALQNTIGGMREEVVWLRNLVMKQVAAIENLSDDC